MQSTLRWDAAARTHLNLRTSWWCDSFVKQLIRIHFSNIYLVRFETSLSQCWKYLDFLSNSHKAFFDPGLMFHQHMLLRYWFRYIIWNWCFCNFIFGVLNYIGFPTCEKFEYSPKHWNVAEQMQTACIYFYFIKLSFRKSHQLTVPFPLLILFFCLEKFLAVAT